MNEYNERDEHFGLVEIDEDLKEIYFDVFRRVYNHAYDLIVDSDRVKNLPQNERTVYPVFMPRVKAVGEVSESSGGRVKLEYAPIQSRVDIFRLNIGIHRGERGIVPEDYTLERPAADPNERYVVFAKEKGIDDEPMATTYGKDAEKILIEFLDSWNAKKDGWRPE